jgi:hypothetical protein
MNILKRLPDDLQDKIYYDLHKSYLDKIKDELKCKIYEIWEKMSIDTQLNYIDTYFPTKRARYSIYDDDNDDDNDEANLSYMNPFIIYDFGYFHIVELYVDYNNEDEGQIYISKLLINPTYGELKLEADKFIEVNGDTDHIFLEGITNLPVVITTFDFDPNVKLLSFILGS